jgi:5-methylcytosine-specific restriction endonuclease McrA
VPLLGRTGTTRHYPPDSALLPFAFSGTATSGSATLRRVGMGRRGVGAAAGRAGSQRSCAHLLRFGLTMIRHESRASWWLDNREWKPTLAGRRRRALKPGGGSYRCTINSRDVVPEKPVSEGKRLQRESKKTPVRLGSHEGKAWWMYRGKIYSTREEDLAVDEVQALLHERENKKRLRIARAKAVSAMADNLDHQGLRQPITREVKVAVWQRDQGRCVQCDSNVDLEFDHIVPLAMGGSNTERNIQLLCATCNREKGSSL